MDLYGKARANFVQKVYSIISSIFCPNIVQILCTLAMSALSMGSTAFFTFQLNNIWLVYLFLVMCLVIQIYMFCCSGGRVFPGNLICLGLFTLSESYIVSFICSATGKESGNQVVLMAAIYTLGKIDNIQSQQLHVLSMPLALRLISQQQLAQCLCQQLLCSPY